jgi:16S rRNA (adenine1518-N6/adenine1519-N6)-dimethyltransferase
MAIKFRGRPRPLFDVPSSSFWPAPKVESAVVAIDRLAEPGAAIAEDEEEAFFHLLRAGFASPRKQLHNALPGALGLSDEAVSAALVAAGLEPAERPQHLELVDWERLYRTIEARHPGALAIQGGA